MTYENPWIYNNTIFTSDNIEDNVGFVYCITNTENNMKYIGKKFFYSIRRQAVKGRVRKKVIKKESDWKTYYGSCIPLKEEIGTKGVELFKREILGVYKTKGNVNYHEVKYQFMYDVLVAKDDDGNRLYYNENILGRYYPKNISS